MDNLKQPAYPLVVKQSDFSMDTEVYTGFTKHEKAAMMIAQGLVSKYNMSSPSDQETIAKLSLELAEEILNRAATWTK